MAFEVRKPGGTKYFYQSVRDPLTVQVRKLYWGRGQKADEVAQGLEQCREQREAERRTVEQRRAELRPVEQSMAALDEGATLLMEALLMVAGFHRPNHGPWRKRRRWDGHGGHRGAVPAGGTG